MPQANGDDCSRLLSSIQSNCKPFKTSMAYTWPQTLLILPLSMPVAMRFWKESVPTSNRKTCPSPSSTRYELATWALFTLGVPVPRRVSLQSFTFSSREQYLISLTVFVVYVESYLSFCEIVDLDFLVSQRLSTALRSQCTCWSRIIQRVLASLRWYQSSRVKARYYLPTTAAMIQKQLLRSLRYICSSSCSP